MTTPTTPKLPPGRERWWLLACTIIAAAGLFALALWGP